MEEEGKERKALFDIFLSFYKKKEICRVCRSEGTLDQPLFHPCKCSGSIRYVHQEW
jgi:E3 ubiquitin-protein ligase DOA10